MDTYLQCWRDQVAVTMNWTSSDDLFWMHQGAAENLRAFITRFMALIDSCNDISDREVILAFSGVCNNQRCLEDIAFI